MIVVVRINKCRAAGGSVAACAYRAWLLSRLLTDANLRNNCKYLVALNGPAVEGVFCIKGVAPDALPRRVQFDLEPVSKECFIAMKNAIDSIYESARLRYLMGSRYVFEEQFRMAGVEVPSMNCCPNGNIPLLEPNQIEPNGRPI